MPDTDPSSSSAQTYEPRHLPVPVPSRNGNGEGWFVRTFRALFGFKPGSMLADLKDVLDAVAPEKNAKRKKPLPAGLDLKAIDLAMPLSAAKIVREILFVPPSARVMDL